MEKNYFALTGNDFGVHIPARVDLLTEAEARMDFTHRKEQYGCAVLFKIKDGQIRMINREWD